MSSIVPSLFGVEEIKARLCDLSKDLDKFAPEHRDQVLVDRLRQQKLRAMISLAKAQHHLAETDVLIADYNLQAVADEFEHMNKERLERYNNNRDMRPLHNSGMKDEKLVSSSGNPNNLFSLTSLVPDLSNSKSKEKGTELTAKLSTQQTHRSKSDAFTPTPKHIQPVNEISSSEPKSKHTKASSKVYEPTTSKTYKESSSKAKEAATSKTYEASSSKTKEATTSKTYKESSSKAKEAATSKTYEASSKTKDATTSKTYKESSSKAKEAATSKTYEASSSKTKDATTSKTYKESSSKVKEAATSITYGAISSNTKDATTSNTYKESSSKAKEAATSITYGAISSNTKDATTSKTYKESSSKSKEAATSKTCKESSSKTKETTTHKTYEAATSTKEAALAETDLPTELKSKKRKRSKSKSKESKRHKSSHKYASSSLSPAESTHAPVAPSNVHTASLGRVASSHAPAASSHAPAASSYAPAASSNVHTALLGSAASSNVPILQLHVPNCDCVKSNRTYSQKTLLNTSISPIKKVVDAKAVQTDVKASKNDIVQTDIVKTVAKAVQTDNVIILQVESQSYLQREKSPDIADEETQLLDTLPTPNSHSTAINLAKALQQIKSQKSSVELEGVYPTEPDVSQVLSRNDVFRKMELMVEDEAEMEECPVNVKMEVPDRDIPNTSTDLLVNNLYNDIMNVKAEETSKNMKPKGKTTKRGLFKILDQC